MRSALIGVLLAAACTTGDDLATDPGEGAIPDLELEVLGQHAIRLHWASTQTVTLRLERRVNLQGQFSAMGGDLPRSQTSLVDDALEPSTFYGYRLVGYDAFGKEVGTSPVVGGQTAPPPGIDLTISTEPVDTPSVDPDGYNLTLAGPTDTVRAPVDVTSHQLFSPLAPGEYRLTLEGLAPQCTSADSLSRTLAVTDQGTATVQQVSIAIQCRNPERGRATLTISTLGERPDSNGFQVTLDGIADDTNLPESERAYHQTSSVGMAGGTLSFEDLRPGRYAFTVDGLAANCTLSGPQGETFPVAALDQVEKAFDIDCEDPDAANRPFALRPTWVNSVAPAGSKVALDLALDLSARAGQDVAAFAIEAHVDRAVLHYDSTTAADIPTVVSNEAQPGVILASGFATGTGPTGVVKLARVWFTVVGSDGQTVRTQTAHNSIVGSDGTGLDGDIRTIEGAFTVGAGGGGGGGNQAPHASANGPYTGTAGAPVTFSSTGSSDPDGTIATYAWAFGDGGTGNGASPTHAYTSAGSYTITLTVTDNGGLTASATAQVTITSSGGGGGGGGGGCGSGTTSQPFVLCSTWSPASAQAGDHVLLTMTVDLTPAAGQDLVAFESTVLTDPALVRFDSARAGGVSNLVVNGTTPGTVRMGGFQTGTGPTDLVTIAKVYYTVLGASGTVTTQTSYSNFVGTSGDLLDGRITKVEGTLTIGSGSGGGGGSGGVSGGSGGSGGGSSALDWQSSFGPVDAATRLVPLNLTLDLRSDPAVTLSAWQVTELRWDPAVLSYASTDFAGGSGSVDPTNALTGRLRLSGRPAATANAGLITVAVVRFVAYGASGTTSAAQVTLGAVTGGSLAGPVDLLPRVVVHDGGFITP